MELFILHRRPGCISAQVWDRTVYMLPAVSEPAVFFYIYLIVFGFARLSGGKNASVFICMDWFHVV